MFLAWARFGGVAVKPIKLLNRFIKKKQMKPFLGGKNL